jgi:hypothetical protein
MAGQRSRDDLQVDRFGHYDVQAPLPIQLLLYLPAYFLTAA